MVWPHPRDMILTPDQVTIIIICLSYNFFSDILLILKLVLVFDPEKLWERLPLRYVT